MKHFAALSLLILAFTFGASAQCTPDPNLTTPGFYPSTDSLPCVERSVPYNTVIQFKNYSTVDAADFGAPFSVIVTVNYIQIDSISGFPAGITYTCTPSNCRFPGGSNGCIEISGTTTAATGNYDLLIYATINADVPGFGTINQAGTSDDLGYDVYLNVINTGDPCPLPEVSLANGPLFSCPGEGAQIALDIDTGGAVGPFTFAWSPTTGLNNPNIANPIATVTATTTYTVTVTDANGFEFSTTVTVTLDNTPTPVAAFSYVLTGNEVVFTNLSVNGTNNIWTIGGSTVTTANPTFTFDSSGTYTVTLITSNNCGSDTSEPQTIIFTGIKDIAGKELTVSVFPNPSKGLFTVSLNGIAASATQVLVYDIQGRKVNETTLQNSGLAASAVLDLSSNGSGIYIVKVLSGSQTSTHKVVVQ
ncbi:hypothetical protein BH09BAC1_BH09BAC1_25620 [soil metagenome]